MGKKRVGDKMKKIILNLTTLVFVLLTFSYVFAGGFQKSGEYYRYFEDDGTVAYDKIIDSDMKKYYVNGDGYVVFKSWVFKDDKYYYAGNDGAFYNEGIHTIDKYKYYFNTECELQKGWSNNYLYYGDPTDGYLVTGFQELDIPKDFVRDDYAENNAWFYFDTTSCERVCATDDEYVVKYIGTSKYCFDQNGVVRTGWRRIKDTSPAMKGYMYFVDETTDGFKYGEAVTNTWYSIEPPAGIIPNGNVKYFYFNGQGQPRCAQEGKLMKVRIADKTYLFNEFGYAMYGVKKVDNDYYYFGPNVENCSMKTGYFGQCIDGSGDGTSFYFQDDGKGYTGVYNNKLYYKGKLQKADSEQKYAAIKCDNIIRLVNTQGVIMKNKHKVKDGDDCEWSTNSGGVVTYKEDDASITEAVLPETNNDD